MARSAWPTLLCVGFPKTPQMKFPASTSFSRSIPVSSPSACLENANGAMLRRDKTNTDDKHPNAKTLPDFTYTMYTTSSVATFPEAPLA